MWLSQVCLYPSYLQWLPLPLWAGFGPCAVCGPVWGCLGFESDRVFSRDEVALNCRALSLCSILRSFSGWMMSGVRTDVCSQSTAGASVRLVCVVIFPSPWVRNHFGVVLSPVWTACTLPSLWHRFEQTRPSVYWGPRSTVKHGGGVCSASKICADHWR